MTISYTKAFIKQAKKLSPAARLQLQERLRLFVQNPLDPSLRNHPLKGRYKQYRSINISGDLRALYLLTEGEAIFEAVGSHSELYE